MPEVRSDLLEMVEQSGSAPGPLVLEVETVATQETVVSCSTIAAGNGFTVEAPGDVTFHAEDSKPWWSRRYRRPVGVP